MILLGWVSILVSTWHRIIKNEYNSASLVIKIKHKIPELTLNQAPFSLMWLTVSFMWDTEWGMNCQDVAYWSVNSNNGICLKKLGLNNFLNLMHLQFPDKAFPLISRETISPGSGHLCHCVSAMFVFLLVCLSKLCHSSGPHNSSLYSLDFIFGLKKITGTGFMQENLNTQTAYTAQFASKQCYCTSFTCSFKW